jgi:ligand-binding sensor domain-containing protein
MRTIFVFFLVCFLSVLSSRAQVPHFQNYTLGKRNESIQVQKIFQDRQGILWFGTNKGLFKFNGKKYEHFTTKDSLASDNVTAIGQDSSGVIWTGHASGEISFLQGKRFQVFETQEGSATEAVSDLIFDRDGRLWFSTLNDGLYYYVDNRLHRLDDQEGLPDVFVYDVFEDNEGRIWAATDRGIAICTFDEGKISIQKITQTDGLTDNIVRKIDQDDDGFFWFATEDAGLLKLDLQTKKFTTLQNSAWSHGAVTDFVFRSGKIWIALSQPGLMVYDPSSGTVKEYNEATGFSHSPIVDLLVDREQNLWSASKTGVLRSSGDELEFIEKPVADGSNNILAITTDKSGAIWYATMDGLFKRENTGTRTVVTVDVLSNTLYKNFRVISLYVDHEDFVWAGLYGEGVLRIDTKSNKVKHFRTELRNGNVLNITGKGNVVWLATLGGGEKVTITGDTFKFENFSVHNGLSSDFIYQIFIDSKDRVWFATDGKGVDRLENEKVYHVVDGLTSKVVYGFAEDGKKRVWANVQDEGLHVYMENEKFNPLGNQAYEKFRDAHISAIASNPSGDIVVIHDLGIDVFSVEKNTVRIFGDEGRESFKRGNLNAVCADRNGNLMFGTEAGIIHYNWYKENQLPTPGILITGIRINGNDRIIENPEFSHNENNLTLSFVGLWYKNPEEVNFTYWLDDYDKEYLHTKDNSVTYSQLPPGTYTFHVTASTATDVNVLNEATFEFTITPPFWRTPVFYFLITFLMISSVYFVIKYRERQLLADKLELEAKVEERTREIQRNTEEIQAQNEEILAQAEEINGINENLEMLVLERTRELEKKNRALEEYAFINAHKLRSPVASILGLINLLNKAALNDESKVINDHLQRAADELDDIVRTITKALERGEK